MQIFVTVGTTKFQELIDTISKRDFLELIVSQGFTRLVVQYGSSKITEVTHPNVSITFYDYKPSLDPDYIASDLVISSGGAGTILEVLELGKPLIVALNTTLQDNHQLELSRELSNDGYLECCYCDTLLDTLSKARINPKPWPKVDGGDVIVDILNEICKF